MNYNFNIEVPSHLNLKSAKVSNDGIYNVKLPVGLGTLYSFEIISLPGINGHISLYLSDKHGVKILPMGDIYNKTYNNYTFNMSGGKYILYGNKIEMRYPEISYKINDTYIYANFIVSSADKFNHLVMINISIIPDGELCNVK